MPVNTIEDGEIRQDGPGDSYAHLVISGTLGGLVAGLVLGLFSLFYQRAIPDGGLDFLREANVGAYLTSILLFCLAYSILGAIIGGLFALVSALVRRKLPFFLPASLAFALSLSLYLTVHVFVATNMALPANVTIHDPVRAAAIWRSLLYGLVFGAFAFVAGIPLFSRLRSGAVGRLLGVALVLITGVSAVNLVRWNAPEAHYQNVERASLSSAGDSGKVIVIGIDGATWQLLDRFSEEGLLPNLDRLRASGATANLVTHGRRVSPAVWTGVATGWSHDKHGIHGFTVPDPVTGTVRLVESGDRLKPAIWQILSEFGKRSVILNWYVGYPAEKVDGVIVARVFDLDEYSVYPEEYLPEVTDILNSAGVTVEGEDRAYAEVKAVFDLAEKSLEDWQPDLLMLYVLSTDGYQHLHWAAIEPEEFGKEWAITEEQVREGGERLRRLWSQVDRRVGDLVAAAGENTSVIIISDHGFKPRSKMMAFLRPNDLLEAMGHLTWAEGEPGVVDFSRTRVFSGQPDTYASVIGFSINLSGRQPEGTVPRDSQLAVARQVAKELSELKVEETGDPLFLRVDLVPKGDGTTAQDKSFDIFAEQAAAMRTNGPGRTVLIAGKQYQLDDFLTVKQNNSGNHAPRGIFIGVGPAFRRANVLPLLADSPYTDVLTYVTGYIGRLEGLYRTLRILGVLDPYTSIDITPTVLYMLGLPYSTEMEGVLMERVLAPELLRSRDVTLIETYDFLETPRGREREGTDSEKALEQLRALGYIQ